MQKRITITFMTAAFIAAMVWSGNAFSADKVGYINLHRLVNESQMGKSARKDIEKLRHEKEEAIKKKGEGVTFLRNQINAEGDKMGASERRAKVNTLKKTYREYQRLAQDAKDDLLNEDRELVAIILEKADGVLKKVAKSNGYAIILKDPNAVGYLDPSVDITDLVLKELNK